MQNEKLNFSKNFFGYSEIINELNRMKEWLSDEELLNNPDVTMPKGIIFYGKPGNGKTLLLREFSNSFEAPTFVIEGKMENARKEISNIFDKARNEKFAIILIDELDLLVNGHNDVVRTLQQELDGINQKGKILVLAACNKMDDIPKPLLRSGRLEKHIYIDYPNVEERVAIFNHFLNVLKVPTNNIDLKFISSLCPYTTSASIKAICNDAYLRCKNGVTTDDLECSIDRVNKNEFAENPSDYKNNTVSVHEAGHILMSSSFKDNYKFYSAKFTKYGGYTVINEVDETRDTVEKREQKIMISLAGYLAEEVCFGKHDVGSYLDYQEAYDMASRLIERVCVKGIKNLMVSYHSNDTCFQSWNRRSKNEKNVDNLLKKFERKTRNFLKKHKNDLLKTSDLLLRKGSIKSDDIKNITCAY